MAMAGMMAFLALSAGLGPSSGDGVSDGGGGGYEIPPDSRYVRYRRPQWPRWDPQPIIQLNNTSTIGFSLMPSMDDGGWWFGSSRDQTLGPFRSSDGKLLGLGGSRHRLKHEAGEWDVDCRAHFFLEEEAEQIIGCRWRNIKSGADEALLVLVSGEEGPLRGVFWASEQAPIYMEGRRAKGWVYDTHLEFLSADGVAFGTLSRGPHAPDYAQFVRGTPSNQAELLYPVALALVTISDARVEQYPLRSIGWPTPMPSSKTINGPWAGQVWLEDPELLHAVVWLESAFETNSGEAAPQVSRRERHRRLAVKTGELETTWRVGSGLRWANRVSRAEQLDIEPLALVLSAGFSAQKPSGLGGAIEGHIVVPPVDADGLSSGEPEYNFGLELSGVVGHYVASPDPFLIRFNLGPRYAFQRIIYEKGAIRLPDDTVVLRDSKLFIDQHGVGGVAELDILWQPSTQKRFFFFPRLNLQLGFTRWLFDDAGIRRDGRRLESVSEPAFVPWTIDLTLSAFFDVGYRSRDSRRHAMIDRRPRERFFR